jgi:hypothetical protein
LPARFADWVGRAIFGTFSLLAALAFGSAAIAVSLLGNPVGLWQVLARWLVVDCLFLAAVFLLLATMSFWSIGGPWSRRLLERLTLKAGIVIVAFGLGMSAIAFIALL